MRDGFIRVAAATPKIKVADPVYNRQEICRIIEEAGKKGRRASGISGALPFRVYL